MKICSYLDPHSLGVAAAVCRSWASVARDDATWRAAFATHFNLEAVGLHSNSAVIATSSQAVPSLRRLTNASWRSEFQRRSELLRRWRKSRAPTVLSTPRVDIIHQISVSKQHTFMLSASQVYGVASRSNPFTGKVTKGYLDAEGTANGAGNGNPNIEFSPNVTALAMGADASSVAWGFRSGEVGLTTLTRQGINPRGAIRSHQFSPRGSHAGPVSAVAVPFASSRDGVHGPGRSPERLRQQLGAMGDVATTFVTAGHDGTVRLWSSLRPLPIWVASTASRTAPPNAGQTVDVSAAPGTAAAVPISALDYDARAGIIVAGNASGKVVAWHGLDIAGLLAIRADASDPAQLSEADVDEDLLEAQRRIVELVGAVRSVTIHLAAGSGAETSLDFVRIDADHHGSADAQRTPKPFSILAHHSGARCLLRHRVGHSEVDEDAAAGSIDRPEVMTTILGAPVLSEITAIKPDFEPRSPLDRKASVAPSPRVSTAASPMLTPSRSDSSANVPRLNIGPSPFDVFGAGQYPEKKYVCVGTKAGTVHVFDWESEGADFDAVAQEEWQGLRPARFTGSRQLSPALSIEAHHTTITSLEVTSLHLIAGTSDGTIKAFCALSGDLIRTINDRTATRHPARMLAAGELTDDEAARFRVQQIVADHDTLIAAIGHQVLAFRAEPLQRAKDKRMAAAAAKKTARSSSRTADSKFQMQVDMRRDLRESQAQLQAEREERQARHSRRRDTVTDHGLGDMTEQEAFEYAMMLSKDEEEAKARAASQLVAPASSARAGPSTQASSSKAPMRSPGLAPADDPELADALEQIALAESRQQSGAPSRCSSDRSWSLDDRFAPDDLDMDDEDSVAADADAHGAEGYYLRASASPSPSPHASPHLAGIGSPSRAWTILGQAGPSTRSNALDRSHPESKIRTINVPRPARIAGTSLSPTSSAMAMRGGQPEDWPTMSPPLNSAHSPLSQRYGQSLSSAASSFRGASPSNTPSKFGGPWNLAAASSPSSEVNAEAGGETSSKPAKKMHNLGAWASGSPSLGPRHRPQPPTESLLAAQLGRRGTSPAPTSSCEFAEGQRAGSGARGGTPLADAAGGDDMDDDLRFAIELSLAEERSRLEREAASRS
ncbi:uncharacterized protein PFL1_01608 [Pseudozyma flocculosa PF-1]|nr:uncharacterized protein PFL1_01608 [Pseudozyma flocculosa PF-1]EPQ30707.1 hypothetical protein PFL1_01608 [Pseudozyma flocculosa PF-1]